MGGSLFNGNISHTTVALSRFNGASPVAYTYRYDQLNRLKEFRQHVLAGGTTTWQPGSAMNYAETLTYDGNGNILTYKRNGAGTGNMGLAMDDMTYRYAYANDPVTGVPYLLHNKLQQVNDAVAAGAYSQAANGTDDIDDQQAGNYTYDRIGNLISDNAENIQRIDWTVYGKIDRIQKANGDIIQYRYDPSGNRVSKEVQSGGVLTKTWYVRDAQGNTLALYSDRESGQSGTWWQEQSLYGSSRLGTWKPSVNIQSTGGLAAWNTVGNRHYELSNHLGNVLAVITDKKLPHDNGSGGVDYYQAEVVSMTDYYAFGMQMPGRHWSSSTYRYGFNGKENDNDVKGVGNQQDYGMRIYDPRLGKFLSVDPLRKEYPDLTPYQFASNTPIWAVDIDGAEGMIPMPNERTAQLYNYSAEVIKKAVVEKHTQGMVNVSVAEHARGMAIKQGRVDGDGITWLTKIGVYFAPWWNSTAPLSDANDGAVLMSGKNLDGSPASRSDYVAAGAGIFIPFVSGGSIKKIFKGVELGSGREIVEGIMRKVDNISSALDEKHVMAAVNDILGNPVVINGKTYDHLTEVRNALKGLGNQIDNLNGAINSGKLSGDVLTSTKSIRSELQIKKDAISDVLNRAEKKAKEN